MRRAATLVVVAAGALAVGVPLAAPATQECRGLQICVPVAGPWVVVPTAASSARPQTEYVLSCPRGFVVGGLDAELASRDIELTFDGRLGSPVNPGVTTTRDAVFRATRTARSSARASFRPHLGCMPASGGGGPRPRTGVSRSLSWAAVPSVFKPGQPTVRHVKNAALRPGRTQRLVARCAAGERLVGASHAFGFYSAGPPSPGRAAAVTATLATGAGRATVTVRNTLPAGVRAVAQVVAICGGGQ
jgi:hypothetical protein